MKRLRVAGLGAGKALGLYRVPSPVAGARPPHWDVHFP